MKPTAIATRSNEIPDALLAELRQNLVARRVASGIELLDSNSHLFDTLGPAQPNAARFVGYAAQWVDVGYREEDLIEKLLARFPKNARSRLAISDYLHLRMAEGVLAMAHDKPDDALFQFDLVLSMQDEIDDKEQV